MPTGWYRFEECLTHRAQETPDAPAFRVVDSTGAETGMLTYATLETEARALAGQITTRCAPGDRVAVLLRPGLAYVVAIFGCLAAGVVAVPAYPPRRRARSGQAEDARVQHLLQNSGAVVALVDAAAPQAAGADPLSMPVLQETGVRPMAPHGDVPPDLAILQYTSGSTTQPRGVMVTHRQLLAHAALLQDAVPYSAGETAVFWIPPYHDMGLMGGILQSVYTGVCSVLVAPAMFLQRPLLWLELLSRYRAVTTAAPDSAYRSCAELVSSGSIDRRAVEALDLSAWRVAFNGAEPVRWATIEAFSDAFSPAGFRREAFVCAYGLAEATLFVSGGPVGAPPRVHAVDGRGVVGCGYVAPGTAVCIVDPERRISRAEGEPGEIWVRGPQVAAGYWNAPEATTCTFDARLATEPHGPGWLRTGDLGVSFGHELIIAGRLKELLIVGGRNVVPQDLEQVAETAHAAVRRDGTVAAQGSDGRIVLFAEMDGGRHAALVHEVSAAIRSACADQLGVHLDVVVCLPRRALPRTSSGKRQRSRTVALWESGGLTALAGEAPVEVENLAEWVCGWIARECGVPRDQVTGSRSIAWYGLDSLAMVRLQTALEHAFGQAVPASALWQSATIDSLAAQLTRPHAELLAVPDAEPSREVVPAAGSSLAEEVAAFTARRAALEREGNPFFLKTEPTASPTHVVVDGERLLSFVSYDYLGLAADARVRDAAAAAARHWGTSASGSRLIGGERPVHAALETALAALSGTQASLVFTSGHATSVNVIPQLVGPSDVVCCDARLHNSGWLGARHSGAQVHLFPHNDAGALDALLARVRSGRRRALVLIEGLYSADGDVPDLAAFVEVKRRHDALLMVDDAHGFGVLGATGRGIAEHQGVAPNQIDLWVGTLSKAFGSVGGFVAGARDVIEWLRYTSPGFVFSAGMPPLSAAAALRAVELLALEPWRVAQLRRNAAQLRDGLAQAGVLPAGGGDTPIIPVITGAADAAMTLSRRLRAYGVLAAPMLPPAVPDGAARVRLFVTAMHTPDELEAVVEALARSVANRVG